MVDRRPLVSLPPQKGLRSATASISASTKAASQRGKVMPMTKKKPRVMNPMSAPEMLGSESSTLQQAKYRHVPGTGRRVVR